MRSKRPQPALVVSIVALVFAMSGLGIAATGMISSTKIKWVANSVPASALKKGSITSAQIGKNAVTSNGLAFKSVTSSKVSDYAITAGEIAPQAVTSTAIAPSAVTSPAIAPAAVVVNKLAPNAVVPSNLDLSVASEFAPTTTYAASAALPGSSGAVTARIGITGDFSDPTQNTSATESQVQFITPNTTTKLVGASASFTVNPGPNVQSGIVVLFVNGGNGHPNGEAVSVPIGGQLPAVSITLPPNSTLSWEVDLIPDPLQTFNASQLAMTVSIQQVPS